MVERIEIIRGPGSVLYGTNAFAGVIDIITKKPGEHIFIPLEAIHRVQNPGKKPVKIVEAQVGSILKESDIVRYQDVYGRVR